MIAAYKFYHGVVLGEIVNLAIEPVSIKELKEEGRLNTYVLNQKAGLHIKHSTARMPPWGFTFSTANVAEFLTLRRRYHEVFIALVCHTDGIVTLTLKELAMLLTDSMSGNAWIRMHRRPGQQYKVVGNRAELPYKKERGISAIVNYISISPSPKSNGGTRHIPELSPGASVFQESNLLTQ